MQRNPYTPAIHPGYLVEEAPGYAPLPQRMESAPGRKASISEWLTCGLLAATAVVQITLAYQFYQVRQAINEPNADPRLESVEERFSKISVVLRFLLDKTKNPSHVMTVSDVQQAAENLPQGADLPLARVMASRLNLRVGPGTSHAPIMTVSAGTMLVVEDLAPGSWVRVVAPNGARAYAQRDQLNLLTEDR